MKNIKKFEQVFSHKPNLFKRLLKFDLEWNKPKWKKVNVKGIELSIQPGFESNPELDEKINDYIDKILKISNGYCLINNAVQIYTKPYGKHMRFRITDIEGDNRYGTEGQMPSDIKSELIDKINTYFTEYECQIDDFEDRGYLYVEILMEEL